MIEANNLVRRYGKFAAVDDVSFSIGAGEVVGLLGHNGAGKTTIMKMLTGFLEPSSGSVCVDGVTVAQNPLQAQAQMGYLPENLPLYPELTVCEYLRYAAGLRGLDAGSAVPEAIEATQLQEKALDPIHTLSRGFKQRVGVAQAILHKPAFLILDEPSNGLDPNQIQHMRELIRDLSQRATVILSTHIMQEVDAICDRTLILRNGALAVDERIEDLHRTDAVVLRTAADADIANVTRDLASIREVESQGPGSWLITLNGSADQFDNQLAELARLLVGASVPIFQMTPQRNDLESVFKQVSERGVSDAA